MNMEGWPILPCLNSYSTAFIHPALSEILNTQDCQKDFSSYFFLARIVNELLAKKELLT